MATLAPFPGFGVTQYEVDEGGSPASHPGVSLEQVSPMASNLYYWLVERRGYSNGGDAGLHEL